METKDWDIPGGFSFFCSVEIMLFRTKKGDRYRTAMGPTGAHRLVGARPVEHSCGSYFGSVKEKSNLSWVKVACPLMLPPPRGGREGITTRNFHAAKKLRGFPMKIELFTYDTKFF